ncbi:collagen alpha-1(X) chain-like isoform X1 [Nycticebus coucang]|uniref:collagen alpha-1(X) chain-like isoform X1 n=1 Tax=Nycticebus coucang TaxID=9470 RepID=UPI00234C95AB|nr:collagen alpha-1(X) chain-like isoform X1 [Nycticebus coucang]
MAMAVATGCVCKEEGHPGGPEQGKTAVNMQLPGAEGHWPSMTTPGIPGSENHPDISVQLSLQNTLRPGWPPGWSPTGGGPGLEVNGSAGGVLARGMQVGAPGGPLLLPLLLPMASLALPGRNPWGRRLLARSSGCRLRPQTPTLFGVAGATPSEPCPLPVEPSAPQTVFGQRTGGRSGGRIPAQRPVQRGARNPTPLPRHGRCYGNQATKVSGASTMRRGGGRVLSEPAPLPAAQRTRDAEGGEWWNPGPAY